MNSRIRYIIYILPVPLFFISLTMGKYPVNFAEIFEDCPSSLIVWYIRMPRILLALIAGASLSLSGAVLQGIFRNPLVSPSILGLSAGASFGAAMAILFFGISPHPLAFIFGILAVYLSYLIAKSPGKATRISLIIGGIVVSALFSAMLYVLKYLADPNHLPTVIYWLMGSLNYTHWSSVIVIIPIFIICFTLVYITRWRLNVLSTGDEESKVLGVDPAKWRLIYITLSTLLAASVTAVCGIIGWIGLIVPHLVRMAFGPDHRYLIPLSASAGGCILLCADDLVRAILPYELPVSVLTSLMGIPFFIYLLRRGYGW